MKRFYRNIITTSLIITILNFISCSDVSKSCCEEILNFSYTENDSLINYDIDIAQKCSEKYHKRPEFLQKISQIYYYDAINHYTSEEILSINSQLSAKKLYHSLEYINSYFNNIDKIKPYDYHFRGEIYERLGDIYKDINSLKQAAELYDKSLSDYESSGNNEKVLSTLIKTGKLYQYNHIPDIAMIYFEMAEERESLPNNIYRKIIDNKIVTLYELNDYKNADSIFKNHFNVKIQDYDFHSAIGTKYFYERNYEKALPHLKYCFENGNQQEKLAFSEKLAETYFNLGDNENEMSYIQFQAKNNSIEIRKTPIKLDLEKLFDTHYYIINNQNRDNKNKNDKVLIAILLTLTVIIVTSVILFISRRKSYNDRIRIAEEKISDNQHIIQNKDRIINDISQKLVELESTAKKESFDEAYSRFCNNNVYLKIKTHFDGITVLTKNVQDYSRYALSNNSLIQLTKCFSSCFPNAVSSLKNDFEGITTNDIRFLILIFMNMNNAEIAVLLGLTYGAANKRSNKIKNIFNTKDDLSTFISDYIKSKF